MDVVRLFASTLLRLDLLFYVRVVMITCYRSLVAVIDRIPFAVLRRPVARCRREPNAGRAKCICAEAVYYRPLRIHWAPQWRNVPLNCHVIQGLVVRVLASGAVSRRVPWQLEPTLIAP